MAKRIITFNNLGRYGRLGNQMFQIASTIGIARKNGFDFAFPRWKNYDHLERFGSREDIEVQDYFVNRLPVYTGHPMPDFFVHWGYHDIMLDRSISLSGHMQSERYFSHCADEIRHYFKLTKESPDNDCCAIHVRLGDYDDNYHPRLKLDYYKRAIEMMPKGTSFIVFSDEPDKAMEMFRPLLRKYVIDPYDTGNYMSDFAVMKSCKHFIIGNSTFSWWAAWLSNQPGKQVVAPMQWFGKVANLSSADIYCRDWKVI